MKAAIVLCALATVCCFSTGYAANNAGTAAITRLKQTTRTTTNDLTRFGRNLVSDLRSKLSNLKIAQINNVNSVTNSALKSIQSEIDEAKAAGKNVDHCFEPSRQRIRLAVLSAFKEQDRCADDGNASINPAKNNIDSLVLQGNLLVTELDRVAINCLSSNGMNMQTCIVMQIPGASAKVQNYQNTANLAKSTADSAASSAQTSTQSCLLSTSGNVSQESAGARSDAHQCVAKAS